MGQGAPFALQRDLRAGSATRLMKAPARAAGSADPAHAVAIEEQRPGSYGHQQHRQARRHPEARDKGGRAVMAAIDDDVAGDGDQELEHATGNEPAIEAPRRIENPSAEPPEKERPQRPDAEPAADHDGDDVV